MPRLTSCAVPPSGSFARRANRSRVKSPASTSKCDACACTSVAPAASDTSEEGNAPAVPSLTIAAPPLGLTAMAADASPGTQTATDAGAAAAASVLDCSRNLVAANVATVSSAHSSPEAHVERRDAAVSPPGTIQYSAAAADPPSALSASAHEATNEQRSPAASPCRHVHSAGGRFVMTPPAAWKLTTSVRHDTRCWSASTAPPTSVTPPLRSLSARTPPPLSSTASATEPSPARSSSWPPEPLPSSRPSSNSVGASSLAASPNTSPRPSTRANAVSATGSVVAVATASRAAAAATAATCGRTRPILPAECARGVRGAVREPTGSTCEGATLVQAASCRGHSQACTAPLEG
mmetsp:Transcript_2531/g.8656  ORF Transcript_2531/g.8656 Transcript_2531/m.8656 type:complete len:351 (+) Transcript_2531:656-1708(+)